MKYKLQKIATKVEGENRITGAMSPMLAAQEFLEYWTLHLDGLARLWNNQAVNSTYDHLIAKTIQKEWNVYTLFVDTGTAYLPVALWYDNESKEKMEISPVYLKEITEEKRQEHLINMEADKRSTDNPIMVLNKGQIYNIFKQAIKEKVLIP